MDIGISSAVFYPELLENSIDKIAELGFKKIEVFFNCDYEISDEYLKALSRKLREAQIEVVSVHPHTSLAEGVYFFSDYRRRTEESIEKYKSFFKAAQFLGAKYLTFHGDRNIRGLSADDKSCYPTEEHCDTLSRLAGEALRHDVQLCLENVSWCKSSNFQYLQTVADCLGDDIGFTLDFKQAERAGFHAEDYIKIMGKRIKNVHISDRNAENDCLLPGFGTFDFVSVLNCLSEASYDGDAIIEVYSTNFDNIRQIEQSKAFLESFID